MGKECVESGLTAAVVVVVVVVVKNVAYTVVSGSCGAVGE